MLRLTDKQKEFWQTANHRWNIKEGATRSGKTYLDYFLIPRRIRNCTGSGLIVLLGNTKGTLERNILEPMRSIWGDELVGSIGSDNTVMLFGKKCHALGADKVTQVTKLQGAGIEYCYRRLLWEFESGERALYVDQSAMRRDDAGNCVIPNRRLYRLLNSGDDTLFADWSPTLRDASILNGLNEILRRIEFNSALAYGTLSDVMNVDRTAEEIKVSKQRSYAHISEIQKCLRTALVDLLSAMNSLCDLYGLSKDGEYNVSFSFDDGVVAEKREEFEERMKLLESGVIEPWEIRVWYLGEDENTAKGKFLGKALPKTGEEV